MEIVRLFFASDPDMGVAPVCPRRLVTPHSVPNIVGGKSYTGHDWRKKRIMMEAGYTIQPNDCPPIRNLNSYGFEYFASAESVVRRNDFQKSRCTTAADATNGWYAHSGERCLKSDSGFFTSWLGNSEYFKVITGLVVYCPVGYGLYQGRNPYSTVDGLEPLAAIEYGNSNGTFLIEGHKYFEVEMNLVCSMLVAGATISRGQSLGVFYPVMNPRGFSMDELIC